jgi:hypothetical protein
MLKKLEECRFVGERRIEISLHYYYFYSKLFNKYRGEMPISALFSMKGVPLNLRRILDAHFLD